MEQALVIFCISSVVFCARNSFRVEELSTNLACGYIFCNFSTYDKEMLLLLIPIFFILESAAFFSQSLCKEITDKPFTCGGMSSLDKYNEAASGVMSRKANEGFIWVK